MRSSLHAIARRWRRPRSSTVVNSAPRSVEASNRPRAVTRSRLRALTASGRGCMASRATRRRRCADREQTLAANASQPPGPRSNGLRPASNRCSILAGEHLQLARLASVAATRGHRHGQQRVEAIGAISLTQVRRAAPWRSRVTSCCAMTPPASTTWAVASPWAHDRSQPEKHAAFAAAWTACRRRCAWSNVQGHAGCRSLQPCDAGRRAGARRCRRTEDIGVARRS